MEFEKVKSIMEIQRLGLPFPKTIFVFDYEKQEKEIDVFLTNTKRVTIRTDKKGNSDYCPHKFNCPKNKAKEFIRKTNSDGYAVILSEHVPFNAKISGNILFLDKKIIIEIMKGSPLTLLNRHGILHEHIQLDKNLKEIFHWGKRIAERESLKKVIKIFDGQTLKNKIVEFSVGPDWMYIWQIRHDESSKLLETVGEINYE